MIKKTLLFFLMLVLMVPIGCAPTLSLYDQYAYTQTTSIKVDVLNLMDLATEDYQSHVKDITSVNTEIQKMYEYDKGRTKDSLTIKQWNILVDPKNLYGRFLNDWKTSGHLSATFIGDKKTNVTAAFDEIVKLENGKNRAK